MNETLKLGLILFLITVVSASVLAVSNSVTSERIAEADKIADELAKKEILPDGEDFKLLNEAKTKEIQEADSRIIEVYEGYNGDNLVGYTFKIAVNGYGGEMEIMTAVSVEGKITGMKVLKHGETPGLGANAIKSYFSDSFRDKSIDKELTAVKKPSQDDEVQALTSATVTTNAVVEGVNVVRKIYNSVLVN